MQSSPVIEASYLINKAAAPLFNPPPGVYAGERQITITSKTPGASIYYTLDGSTNPSRASALYLGPLIVSSSKLIKAVAVKDGMKDSNITSGEYIINKTEPPQFNPPAGTYAGAQNITLFTSTPGASIHYTLDGSAPGRFSPFYTGPIALSAYGTSEIKAIAYKTDMADSAVAGAVYLILERAAAPLFNPAAGVYDSARSVTITSATPGASIYYTLERVMNVGSNGRRCYSYILNCRVRSAGRRENRRCDALSGIYSICGRGNRRIGHAGFNGDGFYCRCG
jgi:hypothetical protein